MSTSTNPIATAADPDCGPRTGEFVTLAAFATHRPPPLDALAERSRRTWSAGDFAQIALSY
ncbi:MAG TPA: hypothetical protein VFV33_25825, partial [Gemmatimonadaceae bacterium]|nr:hypothetical protein [Gemmatimonadaceae bacterium]